VVRHRRRREVPLSTPNSKLPTPNSLPMPGSWALAVGSLRLI